MEDLEYKSTTAKRHAASRRQQQQQQQQQPPHMQGVDGGLPLHTPTNKPSIPQPPRSGQHLLHHHQFNNTNNVLQFKVRDKTDASGKRRFQVNIPRKLLFMLAVIFFVVPLLIFFYKEIHIHDDHEHYKPERFINVDTQDVLSQMLGNKNSTVDVKTKSVNDAGQGENTSPDDQKLAANNKNATGAVESVEEKANPSKSQSSKERQRIRRLVSRRK